MPWTIGSRVKRDERLAARIEQRTVDLDAADRIRTVEHDEPDAVLGGGFHRVAHGRDVGVEARANVLNVEDQRVDAREHLGGRPAGFAVQAVDGDAGIRVAAVVDVGPRRVCRRAHAPG